jgi:hypothetical protein
MKYKFTTQLYHKAGTSQSRVLSPQTLSITLLHQRKHQDLHGMKSTLNQCSFKQGITPIPRLIYVGPVIHQVAQAGFPEEPPKDEQAVLIHAEFSDSAGPEKAHFSVFPLL